MIAFDDSICNCQIDQKIMISFSISGSVKVAIIYMYDFNCYIWSVILIAISLGIISNMVLISTLVGIISNVVLIATLIGIISCRGKPVDSGGSTVGEFAT